MEEYREDRQRRREVWYDENLVPGSTAAMIALAATEADPDLVESYIAFVVPHEGDWLTYGQWVEGELSISLEQGHGTMMPPNDWDQHYQWISRMWNELAKVTEEHHDQDGASATEVDLRNRRKADAEEATRIHEKAQVMLLRISPSIISIPGKLYARYDVENNHVLGFGFMPHGSDAGYFGPSAVPEENAWPGPERFWEAVRTYLANVDEISGEPAMAVVWEEDGWSVQ